GAHHAFLFEPGNQAVDSGVEILGAHFGLVAASRKQCRLVHQVREIRTRKARRSSGDHLQVDLWRNAHALGVNPKNVFAPFDVRLVDEHLTIEPPGPEQRRVKDFRTVRRGHDDDALAAVEAVHLGEQLVEGLFTFLVAADRALYTRLPERVELVDEDDA